MGGWTKDRWNQELARVDTVIREGQIPEAQTQLRAFVRSGIPRAHLAWVATLARRAGLAMQGVRLLNPIVRRANGPSNATDREKAEYAACLTYVGAAEEASALLATLDAEKLPEVLFYRVLALFPQWDYAAAVPLLQTYVARLPAGYQRLVAMTNLADALTYVGDFRQAAPLLRTLLHDAGVARHALVLSRAQQIAARYYLERGEWKSATQALDQARQHLPEDGLQKFLVEKWSKLTQYAAGGGKESALLASVRSEAQRLEHWETLRDCDRWEAVIGKNADRLARVFFGTPFPNYRRQLLKDAGNRTLPETYAWRLGGEGKGPTLDLTTDVSMSLKTGQLLHRLLRSLSADFYRPVRGPSLHAQLYPDQYFNPASSPLQVRTALVRLRGWFENQKLPLTVAQSDGGYWLEATAPCSVVVPRERVADHDVPMLPRLKAQFVSKRFSAREASETLGVSIRSAQRILQDALDAGALLRTGTGPATRYSFPAG